MYSVNDLWLLEYLSLVVVSTIYYGKDAAELKRALRRAPEQFDVWKASLTQ